jgi:hypothetical protein
VENLLFTAFCHLPFIILGVARLFYTVIEGNLSRNKFIGYMVIKKKKKIKKIGSYLLEQD